MIGYEAPNTTPVVDENGYINPLWAAFFDSFLKGTVTASTPSGGVMMFDGSAEPEGWLFCDGREVSRRFYENLFLAIGTRFGAGDGMTTFNIPDRRGKFIKGTMSIGTVDTGGASDYTITVENLPSGLTIDIVDPGHTHTFSGSPTAVTVNDPGHFHGMGASVAGSTTDLTGASPTYSSTNTASATTGITIPNITPLGSNATATTGITASISGGAGEALTIEPPFVTTSFLIKT